MINAKTGKLTSIADDFVRPNGLCFDPTEKLMYIADRCTEQAAISTAPLAAGRNHSCCWCCFACRGCVCAF